MGGEAKREPPILPEVGLVLPQLRCQCQKYKKTFKINGSGIPFDCVGSVSELRKEVP